LLEASVSFLEKASLVFIKVEAEFTQNQVQCMILAVLQKLLTSDFENIFTSNKRINVDELSLLVNCFTGLHDDTSLFFVS